MNNNTASPKDLDSIKRKIKVVLKKLYDRDAILFRRELCERCLVFRFGLYLQEIFQNLYYVDCDYNSHTRNGQVFRGKAISNLDGTITNRFPDIIVHKRSLHGEDSDYICFEIKKWNNKNKREILTDQNKLKKLTSEYGYKYGFHLILGKNLKATQWTIFGRNSYAEPKQKIF